MRKSPHLICGRRNFKITFRRRAVKFGPGTKLRQGLFAFELGADRTTTGLFADAAFASGLGVARITGGRFGRMTGTVGVATGTSVGETVGSTTGGDVAGGADAVGATGIGVDAVGAATVSPEYFPLCQTCARLADVKSISMVDFLGFNGSDGNSICFPFNFN